MANKIQLRRGLKSDLPTLASGEPGYITDTRELYIGTGGGNVNMGGSHWYIGTAMSGTNSAANTYSYSGCPDVKLDDIYLNTSNGNIYTCTTAGSGTNAKWTYRGNIKGAKGDTGATGAKGDDGESAIVDSELSATSVNPVQNKVITEALDLKADSSDFYKHGYAGAGEVVSDVSDIVSEKIAPPTTLVISSSTSRHKNYADFQCSSGDSTTKFQNAIDALPANGGKIVILEGTYIISSALTCNKNIVFEGMGDGTVINCTNIGNNGVFLLSADKSLQLSNFKFTISVNTSLNSAEYTALIKGSNHSGYITISNVYASITFGNNSSAICGAVFRDCRIRGCLNRISINRNSAYYNVNVFYDCDCVFENSIIEGTQYIGYNNEDLHLSFSNCYITCVSPTQYGGNYNKSNSGKLVNNKLIISGGGYCGFSIISGNEISKTSTQALQLYGDVVTGNTIFNYRSNDISFKQYAIVSGNVSKYTMSSSTPTGTVISGNVVNSNL